MAPGVPWTSHQQMELVDELFPNLLHAYPVFSQLLSWHKDAKTIHSSCRRSVRFCPDGEMRTSEAMNPAILLRSSSASFEKDTEFSLDSGCRFRWVQVWGYHINKRIILNQVLRYLHFLFVLYTPLGTYLLSGRSTTVWKRDPITGTISGKLFSLLSFRAGWDADRLRAWASSRLTSFIGREAEGRVKLFTTDALSEKQENTFQPGVRRDESKCFMTLFDWNISCGAGKEVARAGRKAFCQISLSAPQQPYPSEYIPSRSHDCQPKAVLCGFAPSAVDASVWRRCLWKPPGFTRSLYSSLTPFLQLVPTLPWFWSSSGPDPNLVPSSFSHFYIFLLVLFQDRGLF